MKRHANIFLQKIKNFFHLFEAIAANLYFGFPSRRLKVIGVTGTDGKTTTTHLIYHVLIKSGKRAGMISSISASGLHTTTPRAWEIQKLLRKAINEGEEYFVLETTSHALDQNRVWGVDYEVSVVTNVTREHLDYHRTFENYVATKAKLLNMSRKAVLNRDDQSYNLINQLIKSSSIITFGFRGKVNYRWCKDFDVGIKGDYNRQNILAAYAVCCELGISRGEIVAAIQSFSLPPGRLDVVYDKEFKVVIDFAHTPNAIRNVLSTIKNEFKPKGRIIHVFGSAGLRDFKKRAEMGRASAAYADISIITEEDYRTESVDKIAQEIVAGLVGKKYLIIHDRQQAIDHAVSQAKKGDIVIITGKGHEQSLCRGNQEYPWDEFEAVKKGLKKYVYL